MKKLVKIMTSVLLAILIIGGGRFIYMGSESKNMRPKLGIFDERLTACPDKPNCVSSFEDGDHFIAAIDTKLGLDEVKSKILTMENTKLISQKENYLHFTFASSLFKFVDDLEILKDGDKLHIRSASRVGYSDLGANRKRVEKLRDILTN
jgi:uncharacterized protein (DUF1499 family)